MSLSRDSREARQLKHYLRSVFRYKQGKERIDFEFDVLNPEIEKLLAGKGVLGLADGSEFEFKVVNEDPADGKTEAAQADTKDDQS